MRFYYPPVLESSSPEPEPEPNVPSTPTASPPCSPRLRSPSPPCMGTPRPACEPHHSTWLVRHVLAPSAPILVRNIKSPPMDPLRRCTAPGVRLFTICNRVFKPTDLVVKCLGHRLCTTWQHAECYARAVVRMQEGICYASGLYCGSDKEIYNVGVLRWGRYEQSLDYRMPRSPREGEKGYEEMMRESEQWKRTRYARDLKRWSRTCRGRRKGKRLVRANGQEIEKRGRGW